MVPQLYFETFSEGIAKSLKIHGTDIFYSNDIK